MKLMMIPAAALAATCVFAQFAQAREHYRHHGAYRVATAHWSRAAAPFEQPQQFAGGFWNNSETPAYRVVSRRRSQAPEPFGQQQQFTGGFWNNSEAPAYRVVSRRRSRAPEPFEQPQQFAGAHWNNSEAPAYSGGLGGRPAAWCGWEMRQLVGGDPGPEYNLARNWAHWGHSGPAGIGAVVVWSHHVGKIVGQQDGEWIVESGNDGHAVRTRPLSTAGAIAFRWG
jgi:hypothetical protein